MPKMFEEKGLVLIRWNPHWIVKHLRDGKVIWKEEYLKNILHDEGEQAILSAYFATAMSGYGAPPANLYIGLDARASLAEADTLVSLSGEPAVGGYARKAVSTGGTGLSGQDFYINQPGAYYRAESKTVTFTASGANYPAVTKVFICTVLSGTAGKLICSLALSGSRTVLDGDSLQTSMQVGLHE